MLWIGFISFVMWSPVAEEAWGVRYRPDDATKVADDAYVQRLERAVAAARNANDAEAVQILQSDLNRVRPWIARQSAAALIILPPLVVLAFGAAFGWAFSGFKRDRKSVE